MRVGEFTPTFTHVPVAGDVPMVTVSCGFSHTGTISTEGELCANRACVLGECLSESCVWLPYLRRADTRGETTASVPWVYRWRSAAAALSWHARLMTQRLRDELSMSLSSILDA